MMLEEKINTRSGMDWLDHHLLRQFLAVAEEGQISRAAERLGIEQPPLSRAIQRLEARVGARLLVRRPRGVELTEAGAIFRDGVVRLLGDFERLADATRRIEKGERGRVAIGVTASTALHGLVHDRLERFKLANPGVELKLQEGQSAQLVEALRGGGLDAAFLWTPPADGLWARDIAVEPLIAAVPARMAPVGAKSTPAMPLTELAGETFIVYGRRDGFGLFAATIAACNRAGFSPNFGVEAPRLGAAIAMVALGMGVVLLPRTLRMIEHPGVRYLDFDGEDQLATTLRVVMPFRSTRPTAVAFRRFFENHGGDPRA